ncbi:hypothetical protein EYF80_013735 [Liparis tanakae]|uniref:Uncharacterized protein n=1 Tax=Liparis tanakae TaxID=230148 RepID=A0A4Z2IF72_9TELE|nr:hypothetical protein EYF80_013735 [Liparis tanakae]
MKHKDGSCGTPDVCRVAVTGSYQDFNGTVLSRLDVLCKVLVLYPSEERRRVGEGRGEEEIGEKRKEERRGERRGKERKEER